MNKQDFIAQLERGSSALEENQVSAAVLRYLAQVLKAGDPEWWKLTEKAWEKRKFAAWNEPWGLFLNALHYEALNDADNPLVPFFPSCGGTAEADPSSGVQRFLPDAPDSFYEHLKTGQYRPYNERRSRIWLAAASIFFQARDLSYYLVEVGSGGGLNLISDLLGRPDGFDSGLISARIGLDQPALAVEDISHRRWLTAGRLPDDASGINQVDGACEALLEGKRRDPNFVQLVDCEPQRAPRFIAKNIPSDDEDVGLLVFNTVTTARMTDSDYNAYATDMVATLKPWGNRALWIEVERVRGELFSQTYEVRAARFVDGAPSQKVIARFGVGSTGRAELEAGVRFMFPPGARYPVEKLLEALQKV